MSRDLAVAEFEARIASDRRFREESRKRAEMLPSSSTSYTTIPTYSIQEALCTVQLGRYDQAQEMFRVAAEWALERLATSPLKQVRSYDWTGALQWTLLSGDRELEVRTAVGEPPSALEWETPPSHGYYYALRSLSRGDEDRLRAAAIELAAVPDKEAIRLKRDPHSCYPGLGGAVQAILDHSNEAFSQALETILTQHLRYARGKGHMSNSNRAVLCVPAVCLAILATRVGMKVKVAERFHQVELHFRVTSLQEWQGEPAYWKPFTATGDILPMALVEQQL